MIDHEDLDRVAAEGLVDAGVAARWSTPRRRSAAGTRTSGPLILIEAGIPLIDGVGPAADDEGPRG